jgi:hypothetical protein
MIASNKSSLKGMEVGIFGKLLTPVGQCFSNDLHQACIGGVVHQIDDQLKRWVEIGRT